MALQHVKKMILVPSETVARLQEKPVIPTPSGKVRELDNEMDEVLHEKGTIEDRLRRYEQLLQRCMHFVSEQRKPFRLTIPSSDDGPQNQVEDTIEKTLESGTPPRLRKCTTHLFKVLKGMPNVSWDQSGILTIDGAEIPHSNIVELILDCVRNRKRAKAQAWLPFVETLAKSNLPLVHINNEVYRKRILELRGSGATSLRKRPIQRTVNRRTTLNERKGAVRGNRASRKTRNCPLAKLRHKNGETKKPWICRWQTDKQGIL